MAHSRKRPLDKSPASEQTLQYSAPKIKRDNRLVTRKITYQERKFWDDAANDFDAAIKITDYCQYQEINILALTKYIASLKRMYKVSRIEILEDIYVNNLIFLLTALSNDKKRNFNKTAEIEFAKQKLNLLKELQNILPQNDEVELTSLEKTLADSLRYNIQNYADLIKKHEKKPAEKTQLISAAAEQASTSIILKSREAKSITTNQTSNFKTKYTEEYFRSYFAKNKHEMPNNQSYDEFFGMRPDGELPKPYHLNNMFFDNAKSLSKQPNPSPLDRFSSGESLRLFNTTHSRIIQERNNNFCYLSSFGRLLSILRIEELDAYTPNRMPKNDVHAQQVYIEKAALAERIHKEKQQVYQDSKQHRFDPEAIINSQPTDIKKILTSINLLIEKKSYLTALNSLHALYSKFEDSNDPELIRLIVFSIIYSGDLLCASLRKKTEATFVKITSHVQTIVDPTTELMKSDFEFIRLRKTSIIPQQQPTASLLRYALLMFPYETARFPNPEKVSDRLPVAKVDKEKTPKEEQPTKKSRRNQEKTLIKDVINSKTNPKYYHAYIVASVLLKTNVSANLKSYIDALNAEVKRVNSLNNTTMATPMLTLAKTL